MLFFFDLAGDDDVDGKMANKDNCTILIVKTTKFWRMTNCSRVTIPYNNHKNEMIVPVKMIGKGKPSVLFLRMNSGWNSINLYWTTKLTIFILQNANENSKYIYELHCYQCHWHAMFTAQSQCTHNNHIDKHISCEYSRRVVWIWTISISAFVYTEMFELCHII